MVDFDFLYTDKLFHSIDGNYYWKHRPAYRDFMNDIIREEINMKTGDFVIAKSICRNYATCTDELPVIEGVIFNPPATIVFWSDGSKTVVKCMDGTEFDKWTGLSMAICKKLFGKQFKHTFKRWCGK